MAEGLTLLDVLRRCGCADCRQEHEEAVAEIDRLRSKLAQVVIANAEVAKLNAEQAKTIERLRAALVKHGAHSSGCSNTRYVAECSCGLWESLRQCAVGIAATMR